MTRGFRWENTVQFPYKSAGSEAEDFEMELSHAAGSGICSHPQGLKTTISAKNAITVTTRYNLPASIVCCSFLQGQNATKHIYETRKSSIKHR